MYESDGQKKIVQSHAYSEFVRQMAGVDDVTPEVLLKATLFDSVIETPSSTVLRGPAHLC